MKLYVTLITTIFVLCGCGDQQLLEHRGKDFVLNQDQTSQIKDLNKNAKFLVRNKQPLRIKGVIKHQSSLGGAWAFISDDTGLVLIDFTLSSPNITLPEKKHQNTIIVEGVPTPDTSVENQFHIIPYAYKFLEK